LRLLAVETPFREFGHDFLCRGERPVLDYYFVDVSAVDLKPFDYLRALDKAFVKRKESFWHEHAAVRRVVESPFQHRERSVLPSHLRVRRH